MVIGVDSALNTPVEACDRISDTARAHHRAFIVEVMGRDCGYLAMAGAVAAGADAMLLREHGQTTVDPSVQLFGLATVLEATAELLDGESPVTKGRLAPIERVEGVLGL